jgi:hypothetical protein
MELDQISNILGNNDTKINKYIGNKLKSIYPDINPNKIDQDLLENIIQNIISEDYKNIDKIKNEMILNISNESTNLNIPTDLNIPSNLNIPTDPNESNINKISNNTNNYFNKTNINIQQNKFDLEIIKQNILMANEIIPEMSIPSDLIYLKGKLNGINTRIMIDTGASVCVVFKSVIDKCKLNYLIDTSTSVMIQGAHGMKPTLGTIWFVEIELEIIKDKFVAIPISLDVIDDSETIKANKIIGEHYDKIKKIMDPNDNMDNNFTNLCENKSHGFDIILGMTFLKSYRANIDFSTMSITLNSNIKIKFN